MNFQENGILKQAFIWCCWWLQSRWDVFNVSARTYNNKVNQISLVELFDCSSEQTASKSVVPCGLWSIFLSDGHVRCRLMVSQRFCSSEVHLNWVNGSIFQSSMQFEKLQTGNDFEKVYSQWLDEVLEKTVPKILFNSLVNPPFINKIPMENFFNDGNTFFKWKVIVMVVKVIKT